MIVSEQEQLPKPFLIEDLGLLYPTLSSKYKRRFGIYKCGFCGNEWKASTSDIKSNKIKSCGCYRKRRVSKTHKTHGKGYTRLYTIWANIKTRTLNLKNVDYINYGGRGITICDEWKNDFMSFYNWAMSNGYSDELTIDRIDNDGNYCPENCRWVDKTIQNRNQRIQKNNKTGYRGVSFSKRLGKYVAQISVNKKNTHLGLYLSVIKGAIAYNNYIIENNLEGFILNEIPEEYLI